MLGSVQIAKVANIPVKIHWSFLLLFVYVYYVGTQSGMDLEGILWMGLLVLAVFFCVVLHEYGHALTARRYGVITQDILLTPIGGIARLESLPEKPRQEFFIAIAGPAVNFAIALLLSLLIWTVLPQKFIPIGDEMTIIKHPSNFPILLFWLNITLALFNLLPAFPMDGGRILRALLAIRYSRTKATRIASFIGQAIAVGFFILAIFQSHFTLGLIGVFIFVTALSEFKTVQMQEYLSKFTIGEITRSNYTRVYNTDVMGLVMDKLMKNEEHHFLVFDFLSGQLLGVLEEEAILKAIKNKDKQSSVTKYLRTEFYYLNAASSLKEVFLSFQSNNYGILPVLKDNRIMGVLDKEMLNNIIQLNKKVTSSKVKG